MNLEKEVAILKKELAGLVKTKGLNHPETIITSQVLDKVIVKLMKEVNGR